MDPGIADRKDGRLTVLCLGAHSDDIEIGCAGTIMRLMEDYPEAAFYWMVFSGDRARRREARESASTLLTGSKQRFITVRSFRDGYFPYGATRIKNSFEGLKKIPPPDIIFTHYRMDLHQDHRLISDLTWNTFRDQLILEYEIPKYDGDLGSPNFFVKLTKSICDRKVQHLLRHFQSQRDKRWFSGETFQALLRLRGIESRAPEGLAEAFYCRKAVL